METIISTGLLIYFIAALAFLIACLEMMFQMYMEPNMILYPYSVFLSFLSEKNEVLRHICRPLGRCRYCNGTWLMIYSMVYLTKFEMIPAFSPFITILFIILGLGLTAFFIRLLSDTLFKDIDAATLTDKARNVTRFYKDIVDESLNIKTITIPTPWQAMMKSYLFIGSFYSTIYIIIPIIIK